MPDDQQQQTPPINLADPAALTAAYQQYLQYLQQVGNQRPAQAPVISQAQLDANRPTSLLGQLGEALGGGAPSDVPMTADQRERAGVRGLFNFSRGLLGTGTFDSIGQALDRGFTEAERGQYNQEAQVAYGQAAAQDWQRQQMADRLAALKESIPLLQGIQRLNMPSLYGPGGGPGAQAGNAPGTVPGFTARDPKVPTVGQQGNNPGNVMADGGLPPGAVGWIPASGGRKVAAFPDLTTGIAANAANLASYAGQGINTVRQAVTRWVGDPKADLGTYVADVAKALGVGPDDKIDLTDPKVQAAFITAQQPHETGKSWFTPADVQSGVQLAADWRSGKTKPPGPTAPTSSGGPTQPATASPAANAAPGPLAAGAPATAAPQGVPLPPGGKPGETAGPAVGIGGALNPATAAKPPDQRAEVTGTGVAGRIPGAYDVASLGPVAPPSSTTAPSPTATQPPAQPGWGTVIGSYGSPPPGVVTPAPQQPPAQQPPAQQPPPTPQSPNVKAQKPDGTYEVPDEKLSLPQFQDRYRHIYSPEELQQRGLVLPDNPTAAQTAYAGVQEAEAEARAAHQTADMAQRGLIQGADAAKAIDAANGADKNAQAARQAYTTLIQGANEKNATALQTAYQEQDKNLASAYKDTLDRQQKQALQTQAEQAAVGKSGQEVAFQVDKKRLDNMTDQATSAHDTAINLQGIASQLSKLPEGNEAAALSYLSPGQVAWLRNNGIISGDKVDAMQVVSGLKNYLAVQMRPIGSGALRGAEMDRFQAALPDLLQSAAGRQKALAFMQAYVDRVQQESDFASDYYTRPGKDGQPSYNLRGMTTAMNAPKSQGGLGEVIPHAPALDAPGADHTAFLSGIESGKPYYGWQKDPKTGQWHQDLMVKP